MGIGYQVSPLHRLIRMNTAELHGRAAVRGENPLFDALKDASGREVQVADGPLRTRSPTVDSILAWRQHLADKYQDQLDEELTWDESSTYESLAAAWQTSATVLRLVTIAAERHLPLWTTG